MKQAVTQGDILRISSIKYPMLVISNDYFNRASAVIACPILNSEPDGPLHIAVESDTVSGTVFCEQLRFFDLGKRSFHILGRLGYFDTIEIADAVQGIFDYHEGLIS